MKHKEILIRTHTGDVQSAKLSAVLDVTYCADKHLIELTTQTARLQITSGSRFALLGSGSIFRFYIYSDVGKRPDPEQVPFVLVPNIPKQLESLAFELKLAVEDSKNLCGE